MFQYFTIITQYCWLAIIENQLEHWHTPKRSKAFLFVSIYLHSLSDSLYFPPPPLLNLHKSIINKMFSVSPKKNISGSCEIPFFLIRTIIMPFSFSTIRLTFKFSLSLCLWRDCTIMFMLNFFTISFYQSKEFFSFLFCLELTFFLFQGICLYTAICHIWKKNKYTKNKTNIKNCDNENKW